MLDKINSKIQFYFSIDFRSVSQRLVIYEKPFTGTI